MNEQEEKPKPKPLKWSEIEPNPNALLNGITDPNPELGPEGARRRAWISWVKGWTK